MDFYRNKNVLITGHTGFKGAWLAKTLEMLGAKVTGYALKPAKPSVFGLLNLNIHSIVGDIRDFDKLQACFAAAKPEIIFHLAAQPLVSEGYAFPRETYETNIMGTVNVLECARLSDSVKSVVIITTDKVYKADGAKQAFYETDFLDGFDPYSNSKSCADMITRCYRDCFLKNRIAVSSARAGNVIGGGDFSENRIVPDCVRAALDRRDIIIRNPNAVRPYQFIMDTLRAYLLLARRQYEDISLAGSYNIAPYEYINNARLADIFCKTWGGGISWKTGNALGFQETENLRIDGGKIKSVLGFEPQYDIETAIGKTVEWTRIYSRNGDINAVTEQQIKNCIRG